VSAIGTETPQRGSTADRRLATIILVLMALGLVLRLVDLGTRALHHDESLDAWFSQRFLDDTYEGYDPVYHGPLRFYITAGFFWLLGLSTTTARLISALAGTALIGLPWFLRRQIGRAATIAIAAILCISPSYLYFSRFGREDAFFAFLSLAFFVMLLAHLQRPRPALVVGLLVTLVAAWAVKESVFLLVLVVGSFLLVELSGELWEASGGRPVGSGAVLIGAGLAVLAFVLGEPLVANMAWWGALLIGGVVYTGVRARRAGVAAADVPVLRAVIAPGWQVWVLAAGIGAFVFVALFTVLFRTSTGANTASTPWNAVFDGLFGGWDYWRSQQDVNRGGQPGYYYLFVLPLYEFVTIGLALVGIRRELRRSTLVGRFALWSAIVSLAAYSYAGERMPWLVVHPLLPFVLLAGLGAQELWERRGELRVGLMAGLLGIGVVVTVVASFQLSYSRGEEPRELLTQAGQASPELAATVERMYDLDRLIRAELGRPASIVIDSSDSAAWPYVWYLRDLDDVAYIDLGAGDPTPGADVVVAVARNVPLVEPLLVDHQATVQPHREWWVPSYTAAGPTDWFRWFVDREIWDETEVGSIDETVFVSPGALALEVRADDLLAPPG